jgi:hypothetical protein
MGLTEYFNVATDSEWDKSRADPWLSTTFAALPGAVVFMTPHVPDNIKARLSRAAAELGVPLVFRERDDGTNLLAEALELWGVSARVVRLLFYFTPKDVEYAVGWNLWNEAIEARKVRQRNNISGVVRAGKRQVYLKDLCGWAGKTSLVKFATGLGIDMPDKGAMDAHKERMYEGLEEKPEDFLRYAVGDAQSLLQVHTKFIDHFRALQRECLEMADADLWTEADIPMTGGALVAHTMEQWLYGRCQAPEILKFAVRKLGILDPNHRRYAFSKWAYQSAVRWFRNPDDLRCALRLEQTAGPLKRPKPGEQENEQDRNIRLLRQFFKARFLHTALDGCSVRWFADIPATNTACYNALVHGGRCHNENPFSYRMGRGLDVDISGCYGEALRSMSYPVGLPTVWSFTPNQTRLTFGEWLDKYEGELEPGLWTATVSGPLDFEQDLIHSKLVKPGDIRKAAWQGDDGRDINSDFVLLRREIKNGIITADILNALRRVGTNAEWAGLRKLELVTAAVYLKSDRVDTVEEWCEAILRDRGEYSCFSGNIRDSRTKTWFAVPLEDFVGRLADRRKHYKAQAKKGDKQAAGMDFLLKLTVNMVYGIMAARYFPVGNTVMANNITARARLGVWQMAKALGLRQTITDGGPYEPGRVSFFREYKPGLDTLSRMWEWADKVRQRRRFGPMAGLNWQGEFPADVDGLALEHVRQFWTPYGLAFPFRVEHKTALTAGAYWSKGDGSSVDKRKVSDSTLP